MLPSLAEDPSDVLRRVSIKLIDQNVCKTLYSARNRKLIRGIIDEQLCAGDLDGGKDTCQVSTVYIFFFSELSYLFHISLLYFSLNQLINNIL